MKSKIMITTFILALITYSTHANEFTLDFFLNELEKSNLELKVEESRSAAVSSSSVGIRISAPSLSFFQRNFEKDSSKGFEIKQTIPYFGKIYYESEYRDKAALVAASFQKEQVNNILTTARSIYIDYWLQSEIISLLNEKKRVISNHIKLAKSGVRSDSMLKLHLLKTESDLDFLDNQILKEEQILLEKKLKISELLNWPIGKLPPKPIEPVLVTIVNNQLEQAPQVRTLEYKVAMSQAKEFESKMEWAPNFELSFMKMNQAQMMPKFTQVSVGVTLPFVFPWEPKSKIGEAVALRRMSEYELEKRKREIVYIQESSISEANAIKAQMELIQMKLIPRARERMKIVNNIAPRDINSLNDHRETMEAMVNLKLETLSLRSSYEKIVSVFLLYSAGKGAVNE